MAKIEVFTKFLCPYCSRAKALLDRKGAEYQEIDVTMDRAGFDAMVERAGGARTVPQINVLDLSFTLRIGVALLGLVAFAPGLEVLVSSVLGALDEYLGAFLDLIAT